jgi:hypothetical protein
MPRRVDGRLEIDTATNAVIRKAIAERLRRTELQEPTPVPERLRMLVDELGRQDKEPGDWLN